MSYEACKIINQYETATKYIMLESCKSGFYVHVNDSSHHFLRLKDAELFYSRQVMAAAA